jgi:hypothetical protein
MKEADILMHLSFHWGTDLYPHTNGAIVPVSAINRMVIRRLNIILLMSTEVIAAEVCIFAPVSALFRQSNSTLRCIRE